MRERHEGPAQPEPVDEVIGALVKRLQAMPVSDPRMRAAILARVRGRRQAPWRATLAWAWQPSVPMLAAAALAVVAIGLGYGSRVLFEPVPAVVEGDAPVPAAQLTPVSNDVNGVRRFSTQFVFADRTANRVSLVGDFNGWGATTIELKNLNNSGVWEATVPLPPGRHTYAFLVNDSVWTLDPRAAKSVDRDFGRTSSVILVNDQ